MRQGSGRRAEHTVDERATVSLGLMRSFELLGKRWTGLIVAALMRRPAYFGELRRSIPGISERMLSHRLTELSEAGLLVREVDPGPPLRVSYQLTQTGEALRSVLGDLGSWAEKHLLDDTVAPRACGESDV
ncbi:helix-turn-helix domain-containing protein [Streptomyces sp. NPDC026673]|uniref:winged helix-turn-helix transcriptional regulator n=1 Tax=Streptomyces sp. NPDC026673 TaxID=3155724 RepID=UPI0033C65D60